MSEFSIRDMSKRQLYIPAADRYSKILYRRCGKSGIDLPMVSLGLWHNFGGIDNFENGRDIIRKAFDLGITHIDLANNYGPPYGSAEETFGKILRNDLSPYRNELFISTKAGFDMWPGPYGNWGSRKYLISSLDHSLKRMGLDYIDLFYHHRPDPNTPLEETMSALDAIVRSGKALYVGISNYSADLTRKALEVLKWLGTPCLIHQGRYSMLDRWVEDDGLLGELDSNGVGFIAFSPLAQGMLSNNYINGIPSDSRAGKSKTYLHTDQVEKYLRTIKKLNEIAENRDQSLAQMALSWLLNKKEVTSVLVGASSPEQLQNSVESTAKLAFSPEELTLINEALKLSS